MNHPNGLADLAAHRQVRNADAACLRRPSSGLTVSRNMAQKN